jgi:hypothetical protein
LVGEERRGIVVLAKGFKGWQGGLDHGNIVGAEDEVENLEDAQRD